MYRAARWVLVMLVAALVGSVVAAPSAAAATADYAYGSHPAQMLTATWTRGAAGRPWVVLVHGGSWAPQNNPGRQYMGTAAAAFRARGFVVFSVDYRDRAQAPWPAQRFDVANAILWIKAHAARFGIDPRRGVAYGFSAGAQLAALMGTVGAGRARVRAVIGVSGPYDPYQQWRAAYGRNPAVPHPTPTMRGVADAGVALARCPAAPTTSTRWSVWPTMYAGTYASTGDARFLLFHAQDDPAVPVALSGQLHGRLTRAGAPSTLVRPATGGHAQAIVWGNRANASRALAFAVAATR